MNELVIRLLVKKILENPAGYSWSLQGLGMLRLYLSLELRLHIWDSRFATPGASPIHDHPWDFTSYVISGAIVQNRYTEVKTVGDLQESIDKELAPYMMSVLHCGEGRCERTEPELVYLNQEATERYDAGSVYEQQASEIHYSQPEDGTVTLVHRCFSREDRDHARIFWPFGTEWGSAEPRPAIDREVHEITSRALQGF